MTRPDFYAALWVIIFAMVFATGMLQEQLMTIWRNQKNQQEHTPAVAGFFGLTISAVTVASVLTAVAYGIAHFLPV